MNLVLKSEVKRIGKSQLEINITVPNKRVGGVLEKVYQDWGKEVEIKGFRKGQAPANRVREKLDKNKVYSEVANRLVSEAYGAAIKERLLKPIVSPQIEIVQFEPETDKDFVFKATTAERPEVALGDYRSELKKLKVQKPSGEIVGPDGQPLSGTPSPSDTSSTSTPSGPSLDAVLQTVLKTAIVEIPDILTANEVNRMLSRLVDQTAQLGLTVEQYLQSQNKNAEQLRTEYAKQAERTLKSELVLEEIAKLEKIEVSEKEIEEALKAAPDQKSKEELAKEENKWYIKSILKRNKTIQHLIALAK